MKHNIRIPIPKCPLAYEVPHTPGGHTAIVIDINTPDIDWQERMITWTLASLINNTDIVMKGVHLYVQCEAAVRERIEDATAKIKIQNTGINVRDDKIISKDNDATPLVTLGEYGHQYDSVCLLDINYWAFRSDRGKKLPIGHVLRHNWGWGAADYCLAKLGNQLKGSERTQWLHDANTAVYGENYKERNKNIATHFFNEHEANWHIDTSILQYTAEEATDPIFVDWATQWKHLGKEAVIALWLFKTKQHAYNLKDSIIIEYPRFKIESTPYPRLCNMRFAEYKKFREAIEQFMTGGNNQSLNQEP